MKLFSIEIGSENKQSLIILHGLFGLSDNWYSIGKELSKNYRVIIPDLRNHGKSPESKEFGFEEMSGDLMELLKEKNIKNPILLGHSMGGKLAMYFTLKNQFDIKALIIADMHLRESQLRKEHYQIIDSIKETNPNEFSSYSEIKKHLANKMDNKKIAQLLLKNIKRDDNKYSWKLAIEYIEPNLKNISIPIDNDDAYYEAALFIKGGNSNYIIDTDKAQIEKVFPYSEIKEIPKASHWLHADNPKMFLEIVQNFLKTYNL